MTQLGRDIHMTVRRQNSNQLSLTQKDECKTRNDTRNDATKQEPKPKSPHTIEKQQMINQKQQIPTLERTAARAFGWGWGLILSNWPNLCPDFYCW